MASQTDNYWLTYLATILVLASKRDKPHSLLRLTIQEFLDDRPAGDEIAYEVRKALEVRA